MTRRILAILLVLTCIAITAAVWIVLRAGGQGEGDIERWIGQQLLLTAEKQLNPRLSFAQLDYQYPTTVVMKELRLTAADPRVPGEKLDVLAAGEAVMTLAELPRVGRPLVVESISLYRPAVRLVKVDSQSGAKGFAGLSGMIKRSADVSVTQPTSRTAQERLKEALSIRRIELIDGRVEYDPRIDDSPPMVLDQITALLQISPTSEGLYRIQTNLGRKPIAESSMRGLVDLDSMRFSQLELTLSADVDGDKVDFLPPELQRLMKKYEATGQLRMTASGELSLADPSMSQLTVNLTLAAANLRFKDYQFPLQQLDCKVAMGDGQLEIQQFSMKALQGEVTLAGNVQFTRERDSQLEVTATNIDLKELIDSRARSETSLSGTLSGNLRLEVPMRVIRAKMRAMDGTPTTNPMAAEPWPPRWGVGEIEITNGRLVKLPVISQINEAVSRTLRLRQSTTNGRERLKLVFELNEDRIDFNELLYVGTAIAGHGKGHVGLDQTVSLTLNGGPVEKLQSLLGERVGGMIGKVTDSLAQYRVTGTIQQPEVSLEVAPGVFGGFNRIGEKLRGEK